MMCVRWLSRISVVTYPPADVTFTLAGANHCALVGAKQRGKPPALSLGSVTEHTNPNTPTIQSMRPIFRSGPYSGGTLAGAKQPEGSLAAQIFSWVVRVDTLTT
jgi:hypothetical protein